MGDECINMNAVFAHNCLRCGMCENNSNSYREMLLARIRYYKERIKVFEEYGMRNFKTNAELSIKNAKHQIRMYRKIIRGCRK